MDIPNTLIGAIFFIALIVPIYIINKKILKKRKLFISKLNEFTAEDQKRVIDYDTWTDNSIIGLSDDNEMLYFIRNTPTCNLKAKAYIKDIKYSFIKENKQAQKIESLELVLELNSNKENLILEFFKIDDDNFIMGEEMRIIKKWSSKLAEMIQKKN